MFYQIYWGAKEVTYFDIGNRFIHLLYTCSQQAGFLATRFKEVLIW